MYILCIHLIHLNFNLSVLTQQNVKNLDKKKLSVSAKKKLRNLTH